MTARRALAIVVALAIPRLAAAAPGFHAVPEVGVVQAAVNGTGTGTITLRNDTAAPITAGSITAEPGCDAAVHLTPLTGFTLAAGATRPLAIACSAAPAGMQRCNYRVRTTTGTVLLELEAVCAYAATVGLAPDATSFDFGTVGVGATATHAFTVQNTGAAPVTRLFADTTDLAGNFTVQAPCNPDARECDADLAAVPPAGTTSVTVACTPRTAGVQTAQLYLTTATGTRLAAPIALSCTGAAASAPVLSVSPGPIDVGPVEVIGAMAAATVHLTNAGSDAVKLLDVQVVDAGTGAALDWTYTALAPCGAHIPDACTLTAGQTTDLDLVFDPSALGLRDATLLINYHDTADRSVSVPLHGIGRGATLDLLGLVVGQTNLDFGTLPVGASAALGFQVTNRGNRDLTDATFTLTPPGPGELTVTTSAGAGPFTVATAAPTTITVTCKLTAPGIATADLVITAADVTSTPIDLPLRCAADPGVTLTATPPAVLLGEVRVDADATAAIAIASTGAPVTLATATLDTAPPGVTVTGVPAVTPATLTLSAAPDAEADLSSHLIVTPATGMPLSVPVTGTAVTAMFSVPAAVSLGTFCVQQPTTPRTLPLVSTGSATIALMAPSLARADSPFDLALVAPMLYPTTLGPLQAALIAATPRRQTAAGVVTDDVIWKTDVDGATTARTTLTATFINNGSAIAPSSIDFDPTPIHLDLRNARQVTLQNCDVSALQLDPPQIPAPFSIDSPNFPAMLLPGETATFSVGFHPTKLGEVHKLLVITSPQMLAAPLSVMLGGTGVASGGDGDGGTTDTSKSPTSFYACNSCATNDPAGALLFGLATLAITLRRRRAP